jgi:hypothetical protein
MRMAIVYFTKNDNKKLLDITKTIAKKLESFGNQVDIINGFKEVGKKLIVHKYIIYGTEPTSLFGKIPTGINAFTSSAGSISGKNAFAFVVKSKLGSNRALLRLMREMEKGGLIIEASEVIKNPKQAEEIINRVKITY